MSKDEIARAAQALAPHGAQSLNKIDRIHSFDIHDTTFIRLLWIRF
jgi:hypothetical protein